MILAPGACCWLNQNTHVCLKGCNCIPLLLPIPFDLFPSPSLSLSDSEEEKCFEGTLDGGACVEEAEADADASDADLLELSRNGVNRD